MPTELSTVRSWLVLVNFWPELTRPTASRPWRRHGCTNTRGSSQIQTDTGQDLTIFGPNLDSHAPGPKGAVGHSVSSSEFAEGPKKKEPPGEVPPGAVCGQGVRRGPVARGVMRLLCPASRGAPALLEWQRGSAFAGSSFYRTQATPTLGTGQTGRARGTGARSRGGLTPKIHLLADSRWRPLVLATTPGRRGDSPMFEPLLGVLRLARSTSRPRTRPDRVLGDKAYSSRANGDHLRRRGTRPTIAQPRDQREHRRRKGSAGGRPPAFDQVAHRGRNTVERAINLLKQTGRSRPAMTSGPRASTGPCRSPRAGSSSGTWPVQKTEPTSGRQRVARPSARRGVILGRDQASVGLALERVPSTEDARGGFPHQGHLRSQLCCDMGCHQRAPSVRVATALVI
jgi:hypothetical protein